MSNEEKAREIAEQTLGELATSFLGWFNECSEMFCKISAEKMAEWKDQQFKECLEKKRKQVATTGQVCLIDEIINELFGEE